MPTEPKPPKEPRGPILNTEPSFRGWVKPGPLPEKGASLPCDDEETIDALSGHFRVAQLARGHRLSTDDVLVAWYGTTWCPSAGRVLDLGSGIGCVAMMAAWRLRGAHVTTVEAQAISVALARKSIHYNGLDARFDVLEGDFRSCEALEGRAPYDLVLGSPPYWPPDAVVHGDHPQKVACRFELRGAIGDYCVAARKHLAPGGVFACVFPCHPSAQHDRVKSAAAEAGLAIVRYRKVWLREGDDYHLGVFVMHRRDDLPAAFRDESWMEPALTIRRLDGSVHPEYQAIKLAIGFPP